MTKKIKSLSKLIEEISRLDVPEDSFLVFRGESKDYGENALCPNIYRDKYIENEDEFYREMQRFNDHEFFTDKTTFDKLSRMQHHGGRTRLLDVSEDLMSAIYMALNSKDGCSEEAEKEKDDACIYVFEIKNKNVKYYDSDAVSVVSNLAKIPLQYKDKDKENDKSKKALIRDISNSNVEEFNKKESAKFLRHEIREEKPQFEPIINPEHITSVLYVRAKFTSSRIRSQKGSFLLFGLNPDDVEKPIKIMETTDECKLIKSVSRTKYPIEKCYIFELEFEGIEKIKKDLEKIGITTPFIYTELDKVAGYLSKKYK